MIKNLLLSIALCLSVLSMKAQWSSNSTINNQVSTATVDQMGPRIVSDGAGGYLIAWTEKLTNDNNIYIQKLDANGVRLWGVSGVSVCTNPNNQVLAGLVSDGNGGAIVVWEDSTGTGGGGLYGQNDIFAQRISTTGTKLWTANGVVICNAIELQSYVNVISDNNGGAIISWHDYRSNGYLGSDIYAQRINGAGAVQWLANGKAVCTAVNPQVRPRLCSDNLGGAFVVWEDYRGFTQSEIYLQRIDINGNTQFAANGVIMCTAVNDQLFPEIIADGTGGAFMTWYDKRVLGNSGVGDIYGQRINAAGAIQWGASGLSLCNAAGDQFSTFANLTCITLDGLGGFYMTWNDLRNGNHDVYLQRFTGAGAPMWTINGIAVNTNTFNELYPSIASDGNNGVYVSWDRYNLAAVDVYGQHFNSLGTPSWPINGLPLANASNSQYNNQLLSNNDGTAIVTFNDKRNNINSNIYAQKVISTGTCITPNVTISTASTSVCVGTPVVMTASGANTYIWAGLGAGATKTTFPSVSSTYTVTGTATDGCSASTTIAITVNTPPALSITSSVTSSCAGSPVTLTANGAQSYVWTNNGATTQDITVNPLSTTTYTVTGTSANGCTATSTKSASVLNLPLITISPTVPTICPGGSTTLTANGAASYVWTNLGNTAAQVVSPVATTTYTVTGTGANGCTNTGTKTVNVNASPNIVISPSNATICEGQSITLMATGANTYNWGTLGTGSTKIVSPTVTTTYTITGTSSVGCTATTTKTVTVNPIPVVSITPSSTSVCSGAPVTFTANGATTYLWSNNTTNAVLSVNPVSTTTYTVTGSSLGCSSTATASVSILTPPAITITPASAAICIGNDIVITANGAASYVWSNAVTTASQTVSPAATTVYTVTGTSANGCTATATKNVIVNALPVIEILPLTTVICEGNSITLTATGANTYSWNTSASGAVQNLTPATTTTYTVTGVSVNGCSSTGTKTVQVNPLPVLTVVPTNPSICSGGTVLFTASGAQTYNWIGFGNASTQSVSPTVSTNYTVIGTSADGCSASTSQMVTVHPNPVVSIDPVAPICAGSSVTLQANGAANYVWNTSATSSTITETPLSNTTYTVTGTSSAGCTGTASQSVVVHVNPIVSIDPVLPVCEGTTVVLQANGAAQYVWNNTTTGPLNSIVANTTATYSVTGTDGNGCSATASTIVTVNPLPVVTASASPGTVCANTPVTLTASGADTYVWDNMVSGSVQTLSPATTSIYTVTGTDINGCSSSSSVTVIVNPCNADLSLKVFIQGFYLGGGEMQPVLLNAGNSMSATETDTITVNLMNALPPYSLEHSEQVVLNTNGTALVSLPASLLNGSYYLVVKHRNAMETWSANPILITANVNYDFTTDANQAYGGNQIMMEPNVYALYSGDINADYAIDAFDYIEMDPDILLGNFGYLVTDLNGDGSTDAFDYLIIQGNIEAGISIAAP